MTMTRKLKHVIPFIILFALLALLWRELFYAKPNELPSPLIGKTVPHFQLPNLFAPNLPFTPKELTGRVTLLNIWATWCYACAVELPMLMKIREEYRVPVYGIAYKDDPDEVKKWLHKNGNPYVMTGDDKKGDVAIDLGVYGTPETYVISSQGKIVYRHIGVITQSHWDEVLYPLIRKYGG